jgi:hypothetical protein
MSVTSHNGGLLLSQRQYMVEILERAGMTDCKRCATPVDTSAKVSSNGPPVSDATRYHGLAGALQYFTFTKPDIAYAVQQVCLYMHVSCQPHPALIKCILRYLQGTLDHALQLHYSSVDDLVAYSDANWVGCPATHHSTSGYGVFLVII